MFLLDSERHTEKQTYNKQKDKNSGIENAEAFKKTPADPDSWRQTFLE
jgi:hypothetical protein